jgi:hypothetical protein
MSCDAVRGAAIEKVTCECSNLPSNEAIVTSPSNEGKVTSPSNEATVNSPSNEARVISPSNEVRVSSTGPGAKATLTWYGYDPNQNGEHKLACGRSWRSYGRILAAMNIASFPSGQCKERCFQLTTIGNVNEGLTRPASSITVAVVDTCADPGWCSQSPSNPRHGHYFGGPGDVTTTEHFDLMEVSLPEGHEWRQYSPLFNANRNAHNMLVEYIEVPC